jgi:hypothetical protein
METHPQFASQTPPSKKDGSSSKKRDGDHVTLVRKKK